MTAATPADVVVLVGNPRLGSRTRALAAAAEALVARLGFLDGTYVLELAQVVGVSFGPEPARGSATVADPFEVVRAARLLVVATPTYKGTYTGLLKIFLDQFGPGALSGVRRGGRRAGATAGPRLTAALRCAGEEA